MDGVLRCSRYAFGPNRLHYCGPDANRELFDYIKDGVTDMGLELLLRDFRTMYPYLLFIAHANNIKDPFDERVVEAYWLGNSLLETIRKKQFYSHLLEEQELRKKIGSKSFNLVIDKVAQGAVPNHSFHVLDIWKRTGHLEKEHTLESMDACRISWGEVLKIDGPFITVSTEPLIYQNGKLLLGTAIKKRITRRLESERDIEQVKVDDMVSIHWDVPCEVIGKKQATLLKKFTLLHIKLANQTI